MQEAIFTNGEIVLADRTLHGTVQVRDGLITSIDPGSSHAAGAIDCDGDLLMPGLVELHTDNMERRIMPRPGTFWPIDAAVLDHDRDMATTRRGRHRGEPRTTRRQHHRLRQQRRSRVGRQAAATAKGSRYRGAPSSLSWDQG